MTTDRIEAALRESPAWGRILDLDAESALAWTVQALIGEAVDEALEAAAAEIEWVGTDSLDPCPLAWLPGLSQAARIVRSHKTGEPS